MRKRIIATLERSKDGYGVMFDEFPNIFSFGETVEKAKANAREAILFAFEEAEEQPVWMKDGFEVAVKSEQEALMV